MRLLHIKLSVLFKHTDSTTITSCFFNFNQSFLKIVSYQNIALRSMNRFALNLKQLYKDNNVLRIIDFRGEYFNIK